MEDDGTKNVIKLKWVLKVKPASDRYKARLVAHGFKQIAGVDYNETLTVFLWNPAILLYLEPSCLKNVNVKRFNYTFVDYL